MNDNNDGALREEDVQSALIEVASKKVQELTNQNLLFEANLVACQNQVKILVSNIKDLTEELNNSNEIVNEKNTDLESTISQLKSENAKFVTKNEVLEQQNRDMKSKIETGYKPQLKEFQ